MSALKKIYATFYRNERGTEPVRDWLKELAAVDRRIIGNDIATVEYGWPHCTGNILASCRTDVVVTWVHQKNPENTAGCPRIGTATAKRN